MIARFRPGDVVRGSFRTGWAVATATWLDGHSDALTFVDSAGRVLGLPVGEFTMVDHDD